MSRTHYSTLLYSFDTLAPIDKFRCLRHLIPINSLKGFNAFPEDSR